MDKLKPKVMFIGEAYFDTTTYPGHEVARVATLNHPVLGQNSVRTSEVVQKFEDGSFETLNTLYVPYKE